MTAAGKMRPTPESKIRDREKKMEREREQGNSLEKGLEETFPASDPVAVTQLPKHSPEKRES
jgi:hypothetical protein